MKKTFKINLPKGMTIKPGSIDCCYDNDSLDISVELEKEKYKPKDGDVVYVKVRHNDNDAIFIYKKTVENRIYGYAGYNIGFDKMVNTHGVAYITPKIFDNLIEYRPATEKEKKLLFDKLAEAGKKWNPDTKHIENVSQNYNMSFEDAQDYISKCGFDIPWNDGDVFVDDREITRTIGNVLKWRINSVWHDAEEEPKKNAWFIAQIGDGAFDTFIMSIESNRWDRWCNGLNIKRWAYIDDLLPDRKEVSI